jgi:hypothetical protein
VPDGHDAAVQAAGERPVGLHRDHELAVIADLHVEDVQPLDTEQSISPQTARGRGRARRVHHRQGIPIWQLGRR